VIVDHNHTDYFLTHDATAAGEPVDLSGTLGFEHAGPGTTILTGESTHTGGTMIRAGTLQIGAGGQQGMIAGDIVNDAVLVFNRAGEVIYGDEITGSGDLVQRGPGILTLTGINRLDGATGVAEGALRLMDFSKPPESGCTPVPG